MSIIPGLTLSDIQGFGHPKKGKPVRHTERIKLETVVPDDRLQEIINTIITHARTGSFGDGVIFVSPVDMAVRIRTGERDAAALCQAKEQPQ